MENAKTLIDVRRPLPLYFLLFGGRTDFLTTETQRQLLPEVRTEAQQRHLEQRKHLRNAMHGEIYVSMEPGQRRLHEADSTRGRKLSGRGSCELVYDRN